VSYLIDTDWLIDVLLGVPGAVGAVERLGGQDVGVSIVSYGELFEGALGAPDPGARLAQYRAFLDSFRLVPLSDPVMERFARTRKLLRDDGRLIPDLDLLIGATAVHHDLTLLTRNLRHFGRIPDLRIHRPS
jgi:predicted nucleic acid-binding protein